MSVCYLFFHLHCKVSKKNLPLFFIDSSKNQAPCTVSKVEFGICLIIPDISLKISPVFHNAKASSMRCSTKWFFSKNDVMKYSSSAPVVKSGKHYIFKNLLKVALHYGYCLKNLTKFQNSNIGKDVSMTDFKGNYFLRILLDRCFSKAATQIYSF